MTIYFIFSLFKTIDSLYIDIIHILHNTYFIIILNLYWNIEIIWE